MISSVVFFSFRLVLDFPQKAAILFSDFCSLLCRWMMFLDDKNVLMSSANCDMCTVGGGCGRLDAYMMNSVGLRDDPCGTPWLIFMSVDVVMSIWKCVPVGEEAADEPLEDDWDVVLI